MLEHRRPGTLHGAWSADVAISTSDRRLKKDIEPLEDALSWEQVRGEGCGAPTSFWLTRKALPSLVATYDFKQEATQL